MAKLYYTPNKVAEVMELSDDAVLDLVNRGSMPALRVSPRITRIPIAAFGGSSNLEAIAATTTCTGNQNHLAACLTAPPATKCLTGSGTCR
jgi:hypothetical protein